jgi:hypothetical protein
VPIEEEILVVFVFEKDFLLPSRYQQEKLEYHIMHLPAPNQDPISHRSQKPKPHAKPRNE